MNSVGGKERPKYESTKDSDFEKYFAARYARRRKLVAVKAPEFATPDWIFWDDNLPNINYPMPDFTAGLEIKCRKSWFRKSIEKKGYMLSQKKFVKLYLQWQRGWPVGIGVSFGRAHDYIYMIDGRKLEPYIGGRTKQTRDRWDVEKVVYIPWSWFEHDTD